MNPWQWLEDIQDLLEDDWFVYNPNGTDVNEEIAKLIACIKEMHRDVSMIRRATDDLPELADINRMLREALARCAEGNVAIPDSSEVP